jgi:molybdenum cofactor cytidylyltransferase
VNRAPSVAGLILAAGESRRMGFPKALLRYREETFLDTLVELFAARCAPVIVVLGAEAERIRAGAGHSPATFVVNANYARGQITSMQCGLGAVPGDADGVLLTLVDHPAVAAATIDALLAWRRATGIPLIRVPRYQGRRGHPIWFSRELIPEFLALPETGAARDVVRGHAAQTEFLDVDDPGILADIDDPEAYRGLTGAGA